MVENKALTLSEALALAKTRIIYVTAKISGEQFIFKVSFTEFRKEACLKGNGSTITYNARVTDDFIQFEA